MTPVELSRTVLRAVRCAVDAGELRVSVPERAVVTVPGPGGCGDWATNIALQLARPAGRPPRDVAEVLRGHLVHADGVAGVEITGPGFLNISLHSSGASDLVRRILSEGLRYGHSDALGGQVVRLVVPDEVRARVVAEAVGRIARSQGARVEAEVAGSGDRVDLRPVPAPADPAPLGPDAARWALLHPAPHDRPRVGEEHLVQRESNPLFRVRYAHARTRALRRNAADLGFRADPAALADPGPLGAPTADPGPLGAPTADLGPLGAATADPGPLGAPTADSGPLGAPTAEPGPLGAAPKAPAADAGTPGLPAAERPQLLALLADHPRILTAAATHRAPDRLARHLVTVADAVLPFLPTVLPRGAEKPSAAHRARLALAEAAGTVLAGGLSLLGIDAPEHL
ncbi:ArgS-related anticodon-binding protein NrtL [Streptomyces sp. NPDC057386]|uniref:ArgS-related anticodon-binding protein NrtL n=1 Tax=Streptomyces sp. NPDC057386 TaxID=3346114 RepID=UPI00363AB262